MADLSIYELEDIIWDEFAQSDDHIVPHSSDENANVHTYQGDSRKKPRREVIGVSSNADDKYSTKCVSHKKEEQDYSTVNKPNNTILEKDPWSHKPDHMFSASCDSDSNKEATSLASGNTRMSSRCSISNNIDSLSELCSDDPILSGKCTAVDNNSYNYPLTHIFQTDNDLGIIDNDREDKESSDLLYYGWPDIGNFEDVDRMFRSCDSSFGLGSVGNEDEIGWFSSSDAIEGSEDALNSKFKFSCPDSNALRNISENLEPSKLKNECSSVNEWSMKSASLSYKASSRLSEIDEPASLSCFSFVNGSNQISESKDNSNLKDQGVKFNGGVQFRISANNQFENNKRLESSYASNQVQPMESSHDLPFEATDIASDEMREKLHRQQGFQPSFASNSKHVDFVVQASLCDPISARNGNGFENHSDIEGVSIGVPAELAPLNVQERSSINSGLNEVSLEATSFRQLQQVMELLDLRTKLCIRDSLYRLARSAEQRHNYANLNGGRRGDRDTSGTLMSEGTNKCTGLMDIETDTNPIDRSIAHLLFHRPSDSSLIPVPNVLSLKSRTMIPGSVTSPVMMVEK